MDQWIVFQGEEGRFLHASVASTPAGLKDAVAAGGITCETVVAAATELALEVTMVCALATTTSAAALKSDLESILELGFWGMARE